MTIDGDYLPSPHEWVRKHVDSIAESGTTTVATIRGLPVVLVTMRAARSGKVRKVPVMWVEHDGTYAVVASQGGAPMHPAWYFNLKANPTVTLQDDREVHTYVAREVEGAERDPRDVAQLLLRPGTLGFRRRHGSCVQPSHARGHGRCRLRRR